MVALFKFHESMHPFFLLAGLPIVIGQNWSVFAFFNLFCAKNCPFNYKIKTFMAENTCCSFLLYFSQLEPFLFYSDSMIQRFHPVKI